MSWESIETRYRNDQTFHAVVDMMRSYLQHYQFTPSELREAAMLAATMHKMYTVRPLLISDVEKIEASFYGEPKPEGAMEDTASRYTFPSFYDEIKEEQAVVAAEGEHVFSYNVTKRNFGRCIKCHLSDVYAEHFNVRCEF